jgi:very-short-patch-repair endonuclease
MKEQRSKQIFPKKDSKIEVKIQGFLETLGIDYLKHKYMNIAHSYQCDIFIPSLNLVIECDGNYWHKYPTRRDIDNIRTDELIKHGFKVLRLWEIDIINMDLNKFKELL